MPLRDIRHAQAATAVVFAATGLVSGTWAARIPAVQERLDLSPGGLAVAIGAIELGAVAGLSAGGAVVARIGSRRSVRGAFCVFAPLLVAPALVPSLWWLAAALVLWAAANSVIDVAVNVQGASLQRRAGRPVLSRLHAAQAFGLLAGGAVATAATAAGIGLAAHATAIAATALAGTLVAARRTFEEPRPSGAAGFARPPRALARLGAVAFLVFLVEGAAINWAAVHLGSERGASPSLAAAGFTAFALAVAVVRLAGDHLVDRAGRAQVARAGALLAAGGTALAITVPSPAVALAGWAAAGAGLAVLAPAILGAAPGAAPALAPPVAIAGVTTVGYLGSFTGPPLIGALAGTAGLSAALALAVVAALAAALLAPRALAPAHGDDRLTRARR